MYTFLIKLGIKFIKKHWNLYVTKKIKILLLLMIIFGHHFLCGCFSLERDMFMSKQWKGIEERAK